jgi:hypothetical protein
VLGTGCGSPKKTTASTATTAAISKAQFIAQGNAICRQGNERLKAAQQTLEKSLGKREPTKVQIAAYVSTIFLPQIEDQIARIKALGAPPGEEAQVATMLALAQRDLSRVRSDPASLSPASFARFARAAHAYGLTACAANT